MTFFCSPSSLSCFSWSDRKEGPLFFTQQDFEMTPWFIHHVFMMRLTDYNCFFRSRIFLLSTFWYRSILFLIYSTEEETFFHLKCFSDFVYSQKLYVDLNDGINGSGQKESGERVTGNLNHPSKQSKNKEKLYSERFLRCKWLEGVKETI